MSTYYQASNLVQDETLLNQIYHAAELLAAKLHTLRKTIAPEQRWLREISDDYSINNADEDE